MTLIRNNVLLFLFTLSLFSCSSGNVGYWEFKLIEKSIDTLTDIFKHNRSKTIEKIESLTKLTDLKDLKKENNVYNLNKTIKKNTFKKNKFYKKKFYKKKFIKKIK